MKVKPFYPPKEAECFFLWKAIDSSFDVHINHYIVRVCNCEDVESLLNVGNDIKNYFENHTSKQIKNVIFKVVLDSFQVCMNQSQIFPELIYTVFTECKELIINSLTYLQHSLFAYKYFYHQALYGASLLNSSTSMWKAELFARVLDSCQNIQFSVSNVCGDMYSYLDVLGTEDKKLMSPTENANISLKTLIEFESLTDLRSHILNAFDSLDGVSLALEKHINSTLDTLFNTRLFINKNDFVLPDKE